MFIDTHTHLFAEQFNEDRLKIVEQSIALGVEKMLLPNIDEDSIDDMLELEKKFPKNCFSMMGIHPCSVTKDWQKQVKLVREWHAKHKFCAVGEIGIDLYWDKSLIEEQKKAFAAQVELAKELGLPIVIHVRDSFEETLAIVDELNDNTLTGVFHCFTGTLAQAKHIINYGGFKLGLGGVLTFKNSGLDKVVKEIDIEHFVLETDSPYLAPTPHRGKRNESTYIPLIAQKLADIKEMSINLVEEITTKNALEIFTNING